MPPLVITLDDTNYAIEQMEQSGPKVFGDRDWEKQLAYLEVLDRVPDDDSLWGHLYQTFRFGHALAEKIRKPSPQHCRNIITYVYSTVYCARGFSLPLVTRTDVQAVRAVYRMPVTTDVARRIQGDTAMCLAQVHKGWARQFTDLIDAVQIDPFQTHLACACILALLEKFGIVPYTALDELTEEVDMGGKDGPQKPGPDKADPLSASNAPVVHSTRSTMRFDDIGGCDNAKEVLLHLAKRLNQPGVAKRWGNDDPFGAVLIHGPKGTGKTTLVEAFANEVELPFKRFNLSDILKGYINHSHAQLDAYFKQYRVTGGVLCFNEADAMLVRRGSFNSHHEDEKLVNEWNNCMDSLTPDDRIVVFLTANFMDKMDGAAIRDGRVNLVITTTEPNTADRKEVFAKRMTQIERTAGIRVFKDNINLDELARLTHGMSQATIRHIIKRAQDKKIDQDIDGKAPGLIEHKDLVASIATRRAERDDRTKRRIGFRTTS